MTDMRGIATGPKRTILLVCGTLSVGLGILGIFLPLLPTTPFLLLAAGCYARSSGRFYNWLLTNRLCGRYIRNYREGRGIPVRQKAFTIALLWVTVTATALFFMHAWWIRLVLLVVAVSVTVHVLRIRACTPEAANPQDATTSEPGGGDSAADPPGRDCGESGCAVSAGKGRAVP